MSVISINLPDSISEKLKDKIKSSSEMEKFVVTAVAEKLNYLEERAKRADLDDFNRILSKVPDVEPEAFDKL